MSESQQEHDNKMRARIASMHHTQYLQSVLNEFGQQDGPLGIKTWNNVCDARFLELGHTNTSFMDCTCCENKAVTG